MERVNQEFKRRGKVVRILPNPQSCIRLYGAIAKEWDEDGISGKEYMAMDPLVKWEEENTPEVEELAPQPQETSQINKEFIVA